jgi:hypothetical protein
MKKGKSETPASQVAGEKTFVRMDKKAIAKLLLDFFVNVKKAKEVKSFLDDYFEQLSLKEVRR